MDTKRLINVLVCRLISKSNPDGRVRCFDGTTATQQRIKTLLERASANPAMQRIAWEISWDSVEHHDVQLEWGTPKNRTWTIKPKPLERDQ